MNIASKALAVALIATATPLLALSAAAAPMSSPLMLRDAVAPSAETVQFRQGARGGQAGGFRGGRVAGFRGGGGGAFRGGRVGGYGGGGFGGPAIGLGIAGAVVGGALLGATQPYGYQPYGYQTYGYDPAYDEGFVVAPAAGGDGVAYCMQRFRSYDPGSGTFLGRDGLRHPCP